MKTIPKNHTRKIKDIFKRTKRCAVYSLDEGFKGRDVDKIWAERALHNCHFPKLRDNEDGTYTVHVHSNLWYSLVT